MPKKTEKTLNKRRVVGITILMLSVIILVIIFALFDPDKYDFYLKCPFFDITGYKCPLCGSQRAIHNLIHLDFKNAFSENAYLFLLLPYLILVNILGFIRKSNESANGYYQLLTNRIAKTILIVLAILFWIIRNVIN